MRTLPLLLTPLLLMSPMLPSAQAGVCDPAAALVCIGYTVISSDCRVGAISVNGLFVRDPSGGGFLFGEVFWQVCQGGVVFSGHSIEALSQGWYDTTWNGARSCGVYTAVAGVDTDCAYGPPYLPTLP